MLQSSTIRQGKPHCSTACCPTNTTKEGEKTFTYGWLDKVMQVAENGETTQSYSYDISGQLATADYGDSRETFLWDGLALLSRNNLKYVNEPAVTGGNPILAGDKMLFDDMLGNTLGVKDGEKFSAIDRDAFGELKPGEKPNLAVNFFTGKPEIDGLGYSFLFRNYRADLGKWQTTDPLGYPDGWNNLAYCNSKIFSVVDPLGLYAAAKYDTLPSVSSIITTYFVFDSDPEFGFKDIQMGFSVLTLTDEAPDNSLRSEIVYNVDKKNKTVTLLDEECSFAGWSGSFYNKGFGYDHCFEFSVDVSTAYSITSEITRKDDAYYISYYLNKIYTVIASDSFSEGRSYITIYENTNFDRFSPKKDLLIEFPE